MNSKKKIVKRTTAFFGLAAVPTAAALGLAYGIRDSKIDLSTTPPKDFGESYFDNKIVKVNDDDFASTILYDPLERKDDSDDVIKSGDLSQLVRLDRKLDINYAHSVIAIDDENTDQGNITVDGGLEYPFSGIKDVVKTDGKKSLFGRDVITGMENDAKSAISNAIATYKKAHNSKTLNIGVYFDKNVINRTVTIYLYELKAFNKDQQDTINAFVDKIDKIDVNPGEANKWIKFFRYNTPVDPVNPYSQSDIDKTYDRIDGKSVKFQNDKTGYVQLFAGANILNTQEMNGWYRFDAIDYKDKYDIGLTKDGNPIFMASDGFRAWSETDFKNRYPDGYKIKDPTGKNPEIVTWDKFTSRIAKSKYIDLGNSYNTNNPILFNSDRTDNHGHIISSIYFAEKGLAPIVEPSVDFKNHILKVKYTFKSFRQTKTGTTRAVGSFSMGEDISNPYEISTYVKEIPLDNLGKSVEDSSADIPVIGDRISLADNEKNAATPKVLHSFYADASSDIDPDVAGYNSLKASVEKSEQFTKNEKANGETITRDNAIQILKEFLIEKTPAFTSIPIVGPGMGILGQMIPSIAAAVQSWMNVGQMLSADPTIGTGIFTDEFVGKLVDQIDANQMVNITAFIDVINSFTSTAWSDLNSLINLSNKVENGETYVRTFQLFHMLAAVTTISPTINDAIKDKYPDAYMGSSTSVLDQLMAWLKKNGIIAGDVSLMDIIQNYRTKLGTIVETIGINRPVMKSDLINQLVNLIPLPLFSQHDSQFNRDTAAILDALLNGKYIKNNSDDENSDRIMPAIINLLNGGGRTSVQTFFQHVLNDNSKDLMKFILGVIGADFGKTDTFDNAVRALITMFKTKVPVYEIVDMTVPEEVPAVASDHDKNGSGSHTKTRGKKIVQVSQIAKNSDGSVKMQLNPTYSGIGVALENMYNDGIHSVPKESYESIIKFAFGPIASLVDMGTLTQDEYNKAITSLYDIVQNGANLGKDAEVLLPEEEVQSVIRLVNAFANKEIVSPYLGKIIAAFMKNGVKAVTANDIKPLATLLMPKLKATLAFADTMTVDRFSEIVYRLFNGWATKTDVVKDMGELVPALATTKIPTTGSAAELIGQIWAGSYSGLASALSPQLNKVTKVFKNGLGGLNDEDWTNIVSAAKAILTTVEAWVPDTVPPIIDTIFNDDNIVNALQGLGHILSNGLGTIDYNDISSVVRLVNNVINSTKYDKVKAAFIKENTDNADAVIKDATAKSDNAAALKAISDRDKLRGEIDKAKTFDDLIKLYNDHKDVLKTVPAPLISESLIEPLSFLVTNLMSKGIDLSTMDIDTILQLAKEFAGSGFASLINMINAGNPEGESGDKAKEMFNEAAFQSLLIDFVVGHKYVGHEGEYAKDQAKTIVLPQEIKLLPRATKPLKNWEMPDPKNPGSTIIFENPLWWDDNEYSSLKHDFDRYKKEIETGKAYHYDSSATLVETQGAKALTATQLFANLVRMQGIPIEMAKINAKVKAANAKIQIFIDALESFKQANTQIQSVNEVTPSSTLTGDQADWAKSIDDLFKLMKTKMLAASSEADFDSLFGGTDKDGKFHGQVGSVTINDHKKAYFAIKPELEKLNDLMNELNSGKVGADFKDRIGKLFTSINARFNSYGVKGVLPGLPPALKTLVDNFVKATPPTTDSNSKAAYSEDTFKEVWGMHVKTGTNHYPDVYSTAFISFKKFISDDWRKLFDNGFMQGSSGWEIVNHFQSSTNAQSRQFGNPFVNGSGKSLTFVGLSSEILNCITDPADHKIFQQIIDEFKKHIS